MHDDTDGADAPALGERDLRAALRMRLNYRQYRVPPLPREPVVCPSLRLALRIIFDQHDPTGGPALWPLELDSWAEAVELLTALCSDGAESEAARDRLHAACPGTPRGAALAVLLRDEPPGGREFWELESQAEVWVELEAHAAVCVAYEECEEDVEGEGVPPVSWYAWVPEDPANADLADGAVVWAAPPLPPDLTSPAAVEHHRALVWAIGQPLMRDAPEASLALYGSGLSTTERAGLYALFAAPDWLRYDQLYERARARLVETGEDGVSDAPLQSMAESKSRRGRAGSALFSKIEDKVGPVVERIKVGKNTWVRAARRSDD